ncbi:MAG: hypothetical protein ACOVQT_15110, partial [Rubrivivax sp.]
MPKTGHHGHDETTSAMTPEAGSTAPTALRRLHAALMPDYNRPAAVYWWLVVLGGCIALVAALASLATRSPEIWLQVAAGTLIAMLAGVFPVRIPGVRTSFAAGEIFIFLLLLLHG